MTDDAADDPDEVVAGLRRTYYRLALDQKLRTMVENTYLLHGKVLGDSLREALMSIPRAAATHPCPDCHFLSYADYAEFCGYPGLGQVAAAQPPPEGWEHDPERGGFFSPCDGCTPSVLRRRGGGQG